VDWEEIDPELGLLFDDMAGHGKLYALERLLWIELWRVPVLEAVDESGIEARHYGPIRVFASRSDPRMTMFNAMLGADRPGAVTEGHLAAALDWTESIGLDCRVPVRGGAEFGEPGAAEDHLNRRGYRRTGALATFVRGLAPSPFQPSAIEVERLVDETKAETFNHFLATGYGVEPAGHDFFIGLLRRHEWRCYMASDEEGPMASAATMMHYEIPQLVFAATAEDARCRGAHAALLHRAIEDIRASGDGKPLSGPEGIFAITEEALKCPDSFSPGARNLIRAGFRLVDIRTVWQPPAELVAPEDDDEEERDEDPDEDDDHSFELGG
jgi:hypothetical protein